MGLGIMAHKDHLWAFRGYVRYSPEHLVFFGSKGTERPETGKRGFLVDYFGRPDDRPAVREVAEDTARSNQIPALHRIEA